MVAHKGGIKSCSPIILFWYGWPACKNGFTWRGILSKYLHFHIAFYKCHTSASFWQACVQKSHLGSQSASNVRPLTMFPLYHRSFWLESSLQQLILFSHFHQQFEAIDHVSGGTPFLLMTDIKCTSPWPIMISNTTLQLVRYIYLCLNHKENTKSKHY